MKRVCLLAGFIMIGLVFPLSLFAADSDGLYQSMVAPALLDGTPESFGKEIVDFSKMTAGPDLKNGVMNIPFASQPDLPRVYCDYKTKMDLSMYGTFYVDFEVSDPGVSQSVSLYFHSGKGWYSMSGRPIRSSSPTRRIVVFNIGSASREDAPDGLDTVDIIRFGFWRGKSLDATVKVGSIRAATSNIVLLMPGKKASNESARLTGSFDKFARSYGISLFPVSEDKITVQSLKGTDAVVIAISGVMAPETVKVLCEYLDAGGYLLAFYTLPDVLMKKMGFESGRYLHASKAGVKFASVNFVPGFQKMWGPNFPKAMKQYSHNIVWSKPLANPSDPYFQKKENRPRIAAWWYDDKGNKTEYPAMLVSGRGIHFSHVLMTDDPDNKQKFLFNVLSDKDKNLYGNVLRSRWRDLFEVGMAPGADIKKFRLEMAVKVADGLKACGWNPEEVVKIIAGLPDSLAGKTGTTSSKAYRLLGDMDVVREKLVKEYCEKLPAPRVETRFFWEHSGLGAYRGDWDRTMKELSEAGFNGILPNMCWGGSACYRSEFLPLDPRVEEYGDQIEQAVKAGKKYGVEVHVWKVNFNCSRTTPEFAKKIVQEKRNQVSFSGKDEGKVWLCPSHPVNRELEIASMTEIATKYEVDGIHFDYIRYPDGSHCYCDGCRDRFGKWLKEKNGKSLMNWPADTKKEEFAADFEQWRCDQISAVVQGVHDRVKKVRPSVCLSAAVFSGYPGTRKSVGQDWGYWIEKGWLDFVCPMDYTDNPDNFNEMVTTQLTFSKGKIPLYPGIGLTVPRRLRPDELGIQIEITRQHNTGGFILFDLNESIAGRYLPFFKEIKMHSKPIPAHRLTDK